MFIYIPRRFYFFLSDMITTKEILEIILCVCSDCGLRHATTESSHEDQISVSKQPAKKR